MPVRNPIFATLALWLLPAATAPASSIVVERSVATVSVREIASTTTADLIVLDGGYDAGLRLGMTCTVSRDGRPIADIVLVDLRTRAATALLLNLTAGEAIRPGDSVAAKIIPIRN